MFLTHIRLSYLTLSVIVSIIILTSSCVSKQQKNTISYKEQTPSIQPNTSHLNDHISDDEHLFEDYNENCDVPIKDPLESWNRFWFHCNDFLYLQILKPLYKGYEIITPSAFRQGLRNFMYHIQTPIRLLNSILQAKFGQAWVELGRFIINTTVGLGGFINVAQKDTPRIPINPESADFGHTLDCWGVGEGIYLIWPVLGPSTIRDTVGTIGDALVGPFSWLVQPIGIVPLEYGLTAEVLLMFNKSNTVIEMYESIVNSSIEPYIALRDAYVKYRRFNKKSICRVQP